MSSPSYSDLTELIPQLLDQMIALGEIAKDVRRALGGNGHRAEKLQEIKQYLEHQASK